MCWLIVVLGAWIWKPWKLELRSIWKDYSSVHLLLLVWNCIVWLCVTRQGGPGSARAVGVNSMSGLREDVGVWTPTVLIQTLQLYVASLSMPFGT